MKIPIIDVFAGPGGLGEGFMSLKNKDNKSIFDIKLSIEKDENAHKTLTLRSFYRQFDKENKKVPIAYYEALREPDIVKRERLIERLLNEYEEGKIARNEARLIELGSKEWPSEVVDGLIKERLNGARDWVLIGGPPCQAYSNVGRSRVGGISRDDHRVYLYREYLRIIEKHNPSVFVMENVKGLLSAKVDGESVFDWMKRDLKVSDNYEIHSLVRPVTKDSDFLIKSENFGIPQKRHRVILLGVRKDINHTDVYLKEKKEQVTLKSVIDVLPAIRSGLSKEFYKYHPTERYKNGLPKREYKTLEDSDKLWSDIFNKHVDKLGEW